MQKRNSSLDSKCLSHSQKRNKHRPLGRRGSSALVVVVMARPPISPATSAFRNKRLSVIAEDGSTLPPSQGRNHRGKPPSPVQSPPYTPTLQASHRPESRQWTDKPPHHSADQSPPGYQHWNDATPLPRRLRFMGKVRGNKQIARRGGWKRLLILILILIILIIAVAVGLGVGLSQRHNSSSPGSSSSAGETGGTGDSNTTSVFPEGSYEFNVYSTLALTACTSITSTWSCYPYTLYQSGNRDNSVAQYNWVISPGDSQNPPQSFNISSNQDPFNVNFLNVPLTLQNQGTADEYYGFELRTIKKVIPDTSISPDGRQTICYYNNTLLRAELYTRKSGVNITSTPEQSTNSGSNLGSTSTTNINWQPWPWAINVTETAVGGDNVPNCYVEEPGPSNGPSVTQGLTVQSTSAACSCGYQNFDLPS